MSFIAEHKQNSILVLLIDILFTLFLRFCVAFCPSDSMSDYTQCDVCKIVEQYSLPITNMVTEAVYLDILLCSANWNCANLCKLGYTQQTLSITTKSSHRISHFLMHEIWGCVSPIDGLWLNVVCLGKWVLIILNGDYAFI